MITLVVAAASAATAPNGNPFDLPAGWSDGPVFRDEFGDEVVARVDARPCRLIVQQQPLAPWPTPAPWLGWGSDDGGYHACVNVPGGALVVDITTARHEVPFNRYLPLVAPMRAAMDVDPVTTTGVPSSTSDESSPIVGGMGLFATLGDVSPPGGGFALHFTALPFTSGPLVGLDFGLGAVGGFLYETELRIGYGARSGGFHGAVYSGVGVDGVTSRVRGSAEAPLGAIAFVTLLPHLTVELGGEGRWYSAGRRADAEGIIGFDEVEAYGGLWFARRVPPDVDDAPMGLWLGGSWKDTAEGWVARVTVGTGTVALP